LFRRWIERRLGGYRHTVPAGAGSVAERPETRVTAAVVGAGLAGLTAAVTLARRGFAVTLFEKQPYLGGKLGAWPTTLPAGEVQTVEHGFHAFFRHYYNLNALLDSLGARGSFRPIEDYTILAADGRSYRFDGIDRTPLLNLLSLTKTGVWSWKQMLANPRLTGLLAMLKYHPERTFERYDALSFQEWADRLRLPESMRLVFGSFARAFFSSPERMSAAELLKSFHAFFLSHDGGLVYDYPTDDFETAVLTPLRHELERHGAAIIDGKPVTRLERTGGAFTVQGRPFDKLVVATDAAAARGLFEASPGLLPEGTADRVGSLRAAQGYAVLRLWTDRRVEADLPGFVITEGRPLLDSISFYHRLETASRVWADRTRGGVYELHCYALPDIADDQIRDQFLEELYFYLPALRGAGIVHEHLRVARDFTWFGPGQYASRPETATGTPGLYLAGDWVKLPFPALLMEAACSSGLLAANAILAEEGLRAEPVSSVPPLGLFAGRP
jgi:isorenieratene synthase